MSSQLGRKQPGISFGKRQRQQGMVIRKHRKDLGGARFNYIPNILKLTLQYQVFNWDEQGASGDPGALQS